MRTNKHSGMFGSGSRDVLRISGHPNSGTYMDASLVASAHSGTPTSLERSAAPRERRDTHIA